MPWPCASPEYHGAFSRVRQRERSNLPGEHRARNSVGYFQGADRQRVRADNSAAGSQWPCSKCLNFLNYSTGEKSLCEDGVYYLEEKIEAGSRVFSLRTPPISSALSAVKNFE